MHWPSDNNIAFKRCSNLKWSYKNILQFDVTMHKCLIVQKSYSFDDIDRHLKSATQKTIVRKAQL